MQSVGRWRLPVLAVTFAVVVALAVCVQPPLEGAVPSPSSLTVRAVLQGDRYIIIASGVAPPGGAWLGRSVYPYGIQDKALQGSHEVVSVSSTFTRSWTVPVPLVRRGSYEVALWSSKVPASQCRIPNDPWCRRNGFHLAGLLAYRGGWLPR